MNTTMVNTLGHATGRFVLSSATNEAQDAAPNAVGAARNANDHGLFTGYLLDALEGRAAASHPDNIDVVELAKFTIKMVKQATAGTAQQQEPTFYFAGNDFFALRSGRTSVQPPPKQPPATYSGRQ